MRGARAILCPAWQWVDVTAADPGLLVHLKSLRNTVPVPKHWGQKRKYLQNKRGLEKLPFVLPGASTTPLSRADSWAIAWNPTLTGGRSRAFVRVGAIPEFIRRTGITEMREAIREKEDSMKMRQKMRERVQPKMGKLNIDYQKLHDAFFKYQEKPALTSHGDMCVFGLVGMSARTQSLTRARRWGGAGRAGTTRARSLRPSTRTSDQASSRPSCGYVCRRHGCQRFRHE